MMLLQAITKYSSILGTDFNNSTLLSLSLSFHFFGICYLVTYTSEFTEITGNKRNFTVFFCYQVHCLYFSLFFFKGKTLLDRNTKTILQVLDFEGALFFIIPIYQIASERHDRVSARGYVCTQDHYFY
jgi:UMF1 family MFS transporter